VSRIQSHEELEVYGLAFKAAMQIFELSKRFPREEVYSLTDQIRRSSRSVCSNLAEAWRKRRYEAAFVSKLNDAESEAGETQTWVRFAPTHPGSPSTPAPPAPQLPSSRTSGLKGNLKPPDLIACRTNGVLKSPHRELSPLFKTLNLKT
jgi:four helix bundle protein